MLPVKDTTVLECAYHIASEVTNSHYVFVATADEEIKQLCVNNGVSFISTKECENGTQCVTEAAKRLKLADTDMVLNWQADHLLLPNQFDAARKAVQGALGGTRPITTLYYRSSDPGDKNKVKVAMDENEIARYFSRCDIPHGSPMYNIHSGIYLFTWGALKRLPPSSSLSQVEGLEQLSWLQYGIKCQHGPEFYSIDTKADYDRFTEDNSRR
jgi:CMP-2-keto-3-deoxyoctulosonic acid synthetase